jgi:hypothetical protein
VFLKFGGKRQNEQKTFGGKRQIAEKTFGGMSKKTYLCLKNEDYGRRYYSI